MKRIFKQLGELATSSKANDFDGAVIRLTAYYTLGVFVVLLVFSLMVYGLFSVNIDHAEIESNILRESAERLSPEDEKALNLGEAAEHLFNILLVSDFILLVFAVFISYGLARKTLAPLALSYRQQQRFVADAAHELRTPLAVMKAGSEVLLSHDRTVGEYKKFIQDSEDEVNRLTRLANDLLFIAQHGKGTHSSTQKFSLSKICNEQSQLMVSYGATKHITLIRHIAPDIFCNGHQSDIVRLVINLLKNAIDYNKEGGTVTVSLVQEREKALLTIADTGIGIAREEMPFIFERFYKADTSRTQSYAHGSGLGLSIAQEIVTFHGGTIHITSELGAGTTVTVEIPSV